ncbi:hypothetical protein [Bradyrhizobium arachidis]|uniref:hypothetical protein n=1 Tax=Bradyrhizobium arachidis TaxID=858423 RepID=UPI0021616009|nr:hypothetical protein [Bradyrhizobium arachidis]UVO30593.1 hypothetical protein KUF59_08005 [Bradyrhizobium arachidis]
MAPLLAEIDADGIAVKLSVISASKATFSMSGGTPTMSKLYPSSSTKHTRAKSASVRVRIFGAHATLNGDSLTLSPPFAPCPWRCTLTTVALTMAYSISGSSGAEQALPHIRLLLMREHTAVRRGRHFADS